MHEFLKKITRYKPLSLVDVYDIQNVLLSEMKKILPMDIIYIWQKFFMLLLTATLMNQ